MFSGAKLSSLVVLATFSARVNAHGYLEQPKPSWKDEPNVNWVTLIDNYWNIGSGGDQCGAFKKMAAEKKMSVKDVALDMLKGNKCGNTVETGAAQPIPSDGKVKWLGNGGGGFTHVGPCEIYLDDKMVLHGDNCEDEFKGGAVGSSQTSDMTVDFSSCNGKCTLTIYWIAFQNAQWQTYVNCVPLSGSGGGGSTTQTEGSGGSTTQTQGSQTSSQSKETSTEQQSNQTPSTEQKTTEAPSNQTPAPNQQNQTPAPQQNQQDQQKQKEEEEKKQQENQSPSSQQGQQNQQDDQQKKEEEQQKQQQNQTPAPQQNQQDQQKQQEEEQKKQQEEQKKQQQQQNQTPATQQNQQDQQKQQEEQQKKQQEEQQNQHQQEQQQSNQTPSTEQRSMDFNNLQGGTGTVQPAANLRK